MLGLHKDIRMHQKTIRKSWETMENLPVYLGELQCEKLWPQPWSHQNLQQDFYGDLVAAFPELRLYCVKYSAVRRESADFPEEYYYCIIRYIITLYTLYIYIYMIWLANWSCRLIWRLFDQTDDSRKGIQHFLVEGPLCVSKASSNSCLKMRFLHKMNFSARC